MKNNKFNTSECVIYTFILLVTLLLLGSKIAKAKEWIDFT
jgi:cell division protein FtsW (lipid II flippase)